MKKNLLTAFGLLILSHAISLGLWALIITFTPNNLGLTAGIDKLLWVLNLMWMIFIVVVPIINVLLMLVLESKFNKFLPHVDFKQLAIAAVAFYLCAVIIVSVIVLKNETGVTIRPNDFPLDLTAYGATIGLIATSLTGVLWAGLKQLIKLRKK